MSTSPDSGEVKDESMKDDSQSNNQSNDDVIDETPSNNQSVSQTTQPARSLFSSSSSKPASESQAPVFSDTNDSLNQRPSQSISQSNNQSLSQSTTQSSSQPDQPTNQSMSQSTNHSNPSLSPKVGERRKRTSVHFTMPPPAADLLYVPSSGPTTATMHLSTKQMNSEVWSFFRLVRGIDDFVWCIGCRKYLVYKPVIGISNLRKHIVVKHSANQSAEQKNASMNEAGSDEEDDLTYHPTPMRQPPYSSQSHSHSINQSNYHSNQSMSHQPSYETNESWSPDSVTPKSTALLVLDYQKDIVLQFLPNYRLYVDRINAVIETMRNSGATIIFVHTSFSSWPLTKEICPRNMSFARLQQQKQVRFSGEGAELYAGLNRNADDLVVNKNRASAFTGSALRSLIDGNNIKSLVICGLATSGAVLSTLLDAADQDYVCTVLKDACWDPQIIAHETLCALVFPTRGTVLTCEELITRYQARKYEEYDE